VALAISAVRLRISSASVLSSSISIIVFSLDKKAPGMGAFVDVELTAILLSIYATVYDPTTVSVIGLTHTGLEAETVGARPVI
jgi:hypothetical protein